MSATRKLTYRSKIKKSFESEFNQEGMHADVDFTDLEQEEAFYQIEFGIPRMNQKKMSNSFEELKEGKISTPTDIGDQQLASFIISKSDMDQFI